MADDIALTLLNDVRRAQQAWLDGRLADVRFEGRGGTDPWRLRATSVFQREGDEWRALKAAAKAACDALTDLDELADAARAYLIADADLYRFEYGFRGPEILAKLPAAK